jgi:tRNA pseudouridine13 synthase
MHEPSQPIYLTGDLEGIGGVIRQRPEDFLVDEQPLYQPAGSGEHIMLFVQKRNLTTADVVDFLARHFKVQRFAVGSAGQKDKLAITRQHFTVHVPGKKMEDFPMIQHESISVLWADYHTSKLRTGHLSGNRFSIRIREVKPTAVVRVDRMLKRLAEHGVPNRFGPQRFGMTGMNHVVGKHLIRGDAAEAVRALLAPAAGLSEAQNKARELFAAGEYKQAAATLTSWCSEKQVLTALAKNVKAPEAIRRIDARDLRMLLNAWQSAIFNRVLEARLVAGTLSRLVAGDLAIKHENDAVFSVNAELAEAPATVERVQKFEISPSGPMWAGGMLRASDEVDAGEVAALEAEGGSIEILEQYAKRPLEGLAGERRAMRVKLTDPELEGGVDEHGAYIRVAFDLPKGAYATAVLAELMKVRVEGT